MKNFFFAKKYTVRNLRNSISENQPLFEFLGNILKLYLAIIFSVRIFRLFELLGNLPYYPLHITSKETVFDLLLPSKTTASWLAGCFGVSKKIHLLREGEVPFKTFVYIGLRSRLTAL